MHGSDVLHDVNHGRNEIFLRVDQCVWRISLIASINLFDLLIAGYIRAHLLIFLHYLLFI